MWYAVDNFTDVLEGNIEGDFAALSGIEAVAMDNRARTRSRGYVEPTN